jgi:hypothetical protein
MTNVVVVLAKLLTDYAPQKVILNALYKKTPN